MNINEWEAYASHIFLLEIQRSSTMFTLEAEMILMSSQLFSWIFH